MLQSIEFLSSYRCFRKGKKFSFLPGINLIVGDQGFGAEAECRIGLEEG